MNTFRFMFNDPHEGNVTDAEIYSFVMVLLKSPTLEDILGHAVTIPRMLEVAPYVLSRLRIIAPRVLPLVTGEKLRAVAILITEPDT